MKKNRKIIIVTVIIFSIFIVAVFLYLSLFKKAKDEETKININPTIKNEINVNNIKTKNTTERKVSVVKNIDNVNLNVIKVSLEVSDKIYSIDTKEGDSVFDAMKKLKENNLFDFEYTEHLGLGAFVNEINGIKGTPGKYWIYYINDTKASYGISNYILKSGDIISWKQESF